ncbi:MAG: PilZ domain-containing protein [Candidatus Acidiferrales bacterium]
MTVKRAARRVPIVAKIEAQAGGFPFIALAENISEGGLLVRTASPLNEGAVVHLRFTLPGTEKPVNANATVRHVVSGASMGVKFEDVDSADLEAIRKYVETL